MRPRARAVGGRLVVEEPAYLAERGILDGLSPVLRVPFTQFVIRLPEADAPVAASFNDIPGVTAMSA